MRIFFLLVFGMFLETPPLVGSQSSVAVGPRRHETQLADTVAVVQSAV
jgi:hypothetical protein